VVLFGAEFCQAKLDTVEEVLLGLLARFEAEYEPALTGGQVGDLVVELGTGLLTLLLLPDGRVIECRGEQHRPLRAEQVRGEELAQAVEQRVLLDRDADSMSVGCRSAAGVAGEVGVAVLGLAVHAPSADRAEHVPAQQVGSPDAGRVCAVGAAGVPRPFPPPPDLGREVKHLDGDDRWVGQGRRTDPVLGRVVVAAAFGGTAVPHHVAGVLRIGKDGADHAVGPPARRTGGVGRHRRRIPCRVGVEP
jgi:hypothetical protein